MNLAIKDKIGKILPDIFSINNKKIDNQNIKECLVEFFKFKDTKDKEIEKINQKYENRFVIGSLITIVSLFGLFFYSLGGFDTFQYAIGSIYLSIMSGLFLSGFSHIIFNILLKFDKFHIKKIISLKNEKEILVNSFIDKLKNPYFQFEIISYLQNKESSLKSYDTSKSSFIILKNKLILAFSKNQFSKAENIISKYFYLISNDIMKINSFNNEEAEISSYIQELEDKTEQKFNLIEQVENKLLNNEIDYRKQV